ncbi:phosphatase PAP2 family protein [Sulfuricystis multivorans]|uniref:phosphatase PAP2 family protein n=1 Tax=Sulfuricystis multivorans TaxID=2211108 RepID=UPI000F830449|nr:phosphatase PAP2 family protein [Sulfuricystis multivorans]
MSTCFDTAIVALHHWREMPAGPLPGRLSDSRVWALPLLALFAAAWLTLTATIVPSFLAINAAARALPDDFWAGITALGDTLPAFAILLPLVARRPDAAAAALITVLIASLASHLLKYGLAMPRPAAALDPALFHVIGPRLSARAMPSGHTTAAFAVAALVGGHTLGLRAWLPMIGLACLIALSRLAVGAHWPTDVLVGAALGWASGFLGLHLSACCRRCRARFLHWLTLALFCGGTLWLLTGFDSGYASARWLERTVASGALLLFALSLFTQRRLP